MIIFSSRTGNIRSIISKLPSIESVELVEGLTIDVPYFIFTYTDGLGDIPKKVTSFLEDNHKSLKGVIASGNTNFGATYCQAANDISIKYNVPVIRKIDLRGNAEDVKAILEAYKNRIEGDMEK